MFYFIFFYLFFLLPKKKYESSKFGTNVAVTRNTRHHQRDVIWRYVVEEYPNLASDPLGAMFAAAARPRRLILPFRKSPLSELVFMNCMVSLGGRCLVATTYLTLISVPGHPLGYHIASTCVLCDYADEGQTGAHTIIRIPKPLIRYAAVIYSLTLL